MPLTFRIREVSTLVAGQPLFFGSSLNLQLNGRARDSASRLVSHISPIVSCVYVASIVVALELATLSNGHSRQSSDLESPLNGYKAMANIKSAMVGQGRAKPSRVSIMAAKRVNHDLALP